MSGLSEQQLAKIRAEVLAEAVELIGADRAADKIAYPDDLAHINRRIGMREAQARLRREYEPEPEPSQRPVVRRPAIGTISPAQAHEGGSAQDDENDEPDTPARRAAREIQDLHNPAVIGYTIGPDSLRLTLRPTTWQQWQDWQDLLDCPAGQTTYRGGSATAHGGWGDVPVVVSCYLDRVPKSPAVEIPTAHPTTGRDPGLCPPCKRGDCDECMAVDHPYLPGLYTCHYVPNPHKACRQARRGGERP